MNCRDIRHLKKKMDMNRSLLVDLPVFLTVARQGTMTRAAAALNTVQSNISSRIQRLEEELGARLLVRDSRRCASLPMGKRSCHSP